jgi:hypothetical protein
MQRIAKGRHEKGTIKNNTSPFQIGKGSSNGFQNDLQNPTRFWTMADFPLL